MRKKCKCIDCGEEKVIHALELCRRCYNDKNKEKILRQHREWDRKNTHKKRESSNKFYFGGNRELALERDNWTCQECGMSQEQCIVIFNRKLSVHHKDENGLTVPKEEKNNDLDNLITMCTRCHNLLHRKINKERLFGDLLEQDDSIYKYPKIRELLLEKKKKLGTITKAKNEFAEEMGLTYHAVDHMHYQHKATPFHGKVTK